MLRKLSTFRLLVYLLFFNCVLFSQENKTNNILYLDTYLGLSTTDGLDVGYSINYQKNRNLFLFRNIYKVILRDFDNNPDFKGADKRIDFYNEYSLLLGKRYIFDNYSVSFLIGLSQIRADYDLINEPFSKKDKFLGFPFEIGIKFFNNKKAPLLRIGDLISIGKPTGFSSSAGFKIYGNLSKESYIGFGLTVGFGWHKYY